MKFIDTHAHLYDKAFSEDILQVIQRMEEAGVTHCILPGIDMSAYDAMISLSNSRPDLFSPCIGLHPTSVGEDWERELAFVKKHARDRRFAAIGEIGIDKYWSTDYLTQQTKVFAEQLELAATPVSYTHLDVYKRQIYEQCPFSQCRCRGSLQTQNGLRKGDHISRNS